MRAGYGMFKEAAPRWMQLLRAGQLSEDALRRILPTMDSGKFRFVKNLGRGQFNMADEVVGNVGGFQGRMVRKLPTVTNANGLADEYGPLKSLIDQYNQRFSRFYQAKPLTPYVAANERGGFQQFGTGRVFHLPGGLKKRLTDLHAGNIGPKGQVYDFALDPKQATNPAAMAVDWTRTRIDPASIAGRMRGQTTGRDMLGNIQQQGWLSGEQGVLQKYLQKSNNAVRRYWALPEQDRAGYLRQLHGTADTRSQQLLGEMNEASRVPITSLIKPQLARTETYHPTKPFSQTLPGKAAIGGAAATGTAGGIYGLYNLFRPK